MPTATKPDAWVRCTEQLVADLRAREASVGASMVELRDDFKRRLQALNAVASSAKAEREALDRALELHTLRVESEPAAPIAPPTEIATARVSRQRKQRHAGWSTPMRRWAIEWATGREPFRSIEMQEAGAKAGFPARSIENLLYRGQEFARVDYGRYRLAQLPANRAAPGDRGVKAEERTAERFHVMDEIKAWAKSHGGELRAEEFSEHLLGFGYPSKASAWGAASAALATIRTGFERVEHGVFRFYAIDGQALRTGEDEAAS